MRNLIIHYAICVEDRGVPCDLHSFPTRRSSGLRPVAADRGVAARPGHRGRARPRLRRPDHPGVPAVGPVEDRKSTRLNSSHVTISYAHFGSTKEMTHFLLVNTTPLALPRYQERT